MSYESYDYEIERIVGLNIKEDTIEFRELCDEYFNCSLKVNKEEIKKIKETFELIIRLVKEQDYSPY